MADAPIGDPEALAELRAAQALFLDVGDTAVLSGVSTLRAAARTLLACFDEPAGVLRRETVDVAGLRAVADLHLMRSTSLQGETPLDFDVMRILFAVIYRVAPRTINLSLRFHIFRTTRRVPRDQFGAGTAWAAHACVVMEVAEQRADADLLGYAIELWRRALKLVPAADPGHAIYQYSLCTALRARFELRAEPADLDNAIMHGLAAVEHVGRDHTDRPLYLQHLAAALMRRYRLTGAESDAQASEAAIAAARELARPGNQVLAGLRSIASVLAWSRFERTGDPDQLDLVIATAREFRATLPEGSADQVTSLGTLRSALWKRFELDRDPGLLDEVVEVAAELEGRTEAGDAALPTRLAELAGYLAERYQYTGDLADLDAALARGRRAQALMSGLTDRACGVVLNNLAAVLHLNFERNADPDVLDEAIALGCEAVNAFGPDDPHTAMAMASLSGYLRSRYQMSNVDSDLDEAVRLARVAGEANVTATAQFLGVVLLTAYERTGEPALLDDAIGAARAFMDAGHAHVHGALNLSNLAIALRYRFERTGALADLDAAADAGRAALHRLGVEAPGRAVVLINIAALFGARFAQVGIGRDADRAVGLSREAAVLLPSGHPQRATALNMLALGLRQRFERAGDHADLVEAVQVARSAVNAAVPGSFLRAACSTTLAMLLRGVAEEFGNPASLDEAIEVYRQILLSLPADLPGRSIVLLNLSSALLDRHRLTGRPGDLGEAIGTAREAVAATSVGLPQHTSAMFNLGASLAESTALGEGTALEEALDTYRRVAQTAGADALLRHRAGRAWGKAAGALGHWTEALQALDLAVEQMQFVAWRGLERTDRIRALRQMAGTAAEAVAAALNAAVPAHALQLLEQARGVLVTETLRAGGARARLHAKAPTIAARMDEIRAQLDNAPPSVVDPAGAARLGDDAGARARETLAREWDALVATAREVEGLANLYRPPTVPELCRAAAGGPVVIVNVAPARCDALILSPDGVNVCPLAITLEEVAERVGTLFEALHYGGKTLASVARLNRDLRTTLAWLWDTVAEPVLTRLGITAAAEPGTEPPHVWWCPVGPASFLPLHAAGHHTVDGDCLLDRVISSYTPTLSTLVHSTTASPAGRLDRLLAVAVPRTNGLADLPNAELEVDALRQVVPGVTALVDEQATRARILGELPDCAMFHFAGHGQHDPVAPAAAAALYPFDHDVAGPITAADLAALRPDTARFAFLSACETATPTLDVPDEALHVAGALHEAGFPQVIATQWAIYDGPAAAVTARLYSELTCDGTQPVDPTRTAAALHATVRELRARYRAQPAIWAPYLHVGR